MDKANEALKLWQEWFEEDGNPVVFCDYDHADSCFFCGNNNPIVDGHEDDCIYIRAKTLVKGALFEGLDLPR